MIFINYRKADSQAVVDRLAEDLKKYFGPDRVFKNDQDIEGKGKWPDRLRQAVFDCEVLLAVIGDRWLTLCDEHGRRRIDDEEDWVRQEIMTALDSGKWVLPLLVGAAEAPSEQALSENPLRRMLDRTFCALRPGREFDADVVRLVRSLSSRLTDAPVAEISTQTIAQPTDPAGRPGDARTPAFQMDRYHILARLGQGGMGTVYKARDTQLQRLVALKAPLFDGTEQKRSVAQKRFLREAQAAAAVQHPHVCQIYDVGERNGVPYVVMAYVEGGSLADRLADGRRYDDCRQAVKLVRQAAEGLEAVHDAGIVHRDLKPGNILLDKAGNPVLADFGLARPENDAEHLTSEGVMVGTPAYMAPEQALPSVGEIGPRTDLYSLGVVLYRAVTGRLPFEGPAATLPFRIVLDEPAAASAHRPDLDPALEAIIRKATAKRPEDRYPTARAFIEALDGWLSETESVLLGVVSSTEVYPVGIPADADADNATTGEPVTPTPPTPVPAARRASGGRWKWAAALLGMLVLIAGGIAAALFWLPLGKPAPVSLGKYGGIEIGSTSVEVVGVEYIKTDEGVTETLLDEPTYAVTWLGDLREGTSDFDDHALQKTVDQVNDYLVALGNLGVPAENQYIAYSSGVRAPFKTDEDWIRNQDRLVNALRRKTGKDAAYVDAHDEAKFSFQELVPPKEWTESVLIDIGGNNIKGGGYARKDLFLDFSVNAGVSMFEKKVTKARDKEKETFAEAAGRLRKTEVEAPLQKDLAESSQLKSRPKVYLLGGLPWALATYTRPLEFYAPAPPKAVGREAFLRRLQPEDIGKFDEMVRTKKPADIKSDIKVLVAGHKDVEAAANENVTKIQTEVFKNPDRLIGGAQILRALDQEFALTDPKKEVLVFRYGQVVWLLGYVRSKSGHTD